MWSTACLRETAPLAPLDECVRVEARAKGRRLLEPCSDLFEHLLVGATHEDADLQQARQVLRHRLEAAHEEVADRDVGPGRASQHLFEPGEQLGVSSGVEDVHELQPLEVGHNDGTGAAVTVSRDGADLY